MTREAKGGGIPTTYYVCFFPVSLQEDCADERRGWVVGTATVCGMGREGDQLPSVCSRSFLFYLTALDVINVPLFFLHFLYLFFR